MRPQQGVSRDSLEAVVRDVFLAPEYDWTEQRDPWAWFRTVASDVTQWFAVLHQEHPVAYWVVLTLMAVLLVAIFTHFAVLVIQALRPRMPAPAGSSGSGPTVRDAAWYAKEARRLEAGGDLRGALALRFTASLVELDRRNVLQFNPAKTPTEYLHEAAVSESVREQMRKLVASVYRYLYSGEPLTVEGLHEFAEAAGRLGTSHVA